MNENDLNVIFVYYIMLDFVCFIIKINRRIKVHC